MAKGYNMRLVLKQTFSEFFREKVQKEQHRSLMMKMMALEVMKTVHSSISCSGHRRLTPLLVLQPFTGEDASQQESQSPQEYSHAEEHCSRAGVTLPLVGLVAIAWSWS